MNHDETTKDEFLILQEEVLKAQSHMKGKKYIIDLSGKAIQVNSTKPENLPPFAYEPQLNILFEENDVPRKSKQQKGSKKKLRVAGSRSVDKSNFLPTTSLATTLSKPNDIMLNPGVSLQTDQGIREGPISADDPKHPSRKQFFNKKVLSLTASNELSSSSIVSGSIEFSKTIGDIPTGKDLQMMSENLNATSVSSAGSLIRYSDIESTEGGRVRSKTSDSQKKEESTNPVIDYEAKGKQEPPEPPMKPSSKQKHIVASLTGGDTKIKPRERLPENLVSTRTERRIQVTDKSDKSETHTIGSNRPNSPSNESISITNSIISENSKGKSIVKAERLDIVREIF